MSSSGRMRLRSRGNLISIRVITSSAGAAQACSTGQCPTSTPKNSRRSAACFVSRVAERLAQSARSETGGSSGEGGNDRFGAHAVGVGVMFPDQPLDLFDAIAADIDHHQDLAGLDGLLEILQPPAADAGA